MTFKYINILKILSASYILSFIFHNISNSYSIRISEYIFIVILLFFFYLKIKKKIDLEFTKIDYLFLMMPSLSLFLYVISNLNFSFLLGFIVITYLFLIYYIARNIIVIIGLDFFLKLIIILACISSFLGILGWALSQFEINNILSINSPYPFFIGKVSRASALFTTPSLLAITTIIGIYMLLIFFKENRNILFYIILLLLLLGLILTFSKSIILFLTFLVLLIYNKKNYFLLNFLIYLSIIFLIIFHSFFTSFLIIKNDRNNEWMTSNFIPQQSELVYGNENIKIIPTNYSYAKLKSIQIIKDNILTGIGYNQYKNSLPNEYDFLINKSPHSSYLGLFTEFGFLMIIFYIILLISVLYISLKTYNKTNNQIFILIYYFIFESLHTDIHTIKLIWIVFAITVYLYKNRLNTFNKTIF